MTISLKNFSAKDLACLQNKAFWEGAFQKVFRIAFSLIKKEWEINMFYFQSIRWQRLRQMLQFSCQETSYF